MPSEWVYVNSIPNCDLCAQRGEEKTAEYDGKTSLGPWAYMCREDFLRWGTGLGVGRGQKLILNEGSEE